ncbi:Fic family protein [Methylopila sp. M107]|uniref:Fic family protein n=1 Tax=Methylopila sp. M107 TaxID=1101190 RepID=UPI0018CB8369|nr:Fic family protein [Methylopila sp. M107]
MAAAILRLSGYEEIDPQSPLGGPDGRKDIVCEKGGVRWIAGVYFPVGQVSFPSIKKKYKSDLQGVTSRYNGFVFVSNQNLTPNQRKTLRELASASGKEADIVHLQQIQNLMDSPFGYGIRIQYLGIPMTIEEQLSWVTDSDGQTARALGSHTREIIALRAAIDQISVGQQHIARTMSAVGLSPAATPDLISTSSFIKNDVLPAITAKLDAGIILLFHRLTCFDLPSRLIGTLRAGDVWLGNADGRRADHIQPPPATDVKRLLDALCMEWRQKYPFQRSIDGKLGLIAGFHARLLSIHPFLDGNGRVSRAILMQQCLDLFGKADMTLMNRGAAYYESLKKADMGDLQDLKNIISPVVR